MKKLHERLKATAVNRRKGTGRVDRQPGIIDDLVAKRKETKMYAEIGRKAVEQRNRPEMPKVTQKAASGLQAPDIKLKKVEGSDLLSQFAVRSQISEMASSKADYQKRAAQKPPTKTNIPNYPKGIRPELGGSGPGRKVNQNQPRPAPKQVNPFKAEAGKIRGVAGIGFVSPATPQSKAAETQKNLAINANLAVAGPLLSSGRKVYQAGKALTGTVGRITEPTATATRGVLAQGKGPAMLPPARQTTKAALGQGTRTVPSSGRTTYVSPSGVARTGKAPVSTTPGKTIYVNPSGSAQVGKMPATSTSSGTSIPMGQGKGPLKAATKAAKKPPVKEAKITEYGSKGRSSTENTPITFGGNKGMATKANPPAYATKKGVQATQTSTTKTAVQQTAEPVKQTTTKNVVKQTAEPVKETAKKTVAKTTTKKKTGQSAVLKAEPAAKKTTNPFSFDEQAFLKSVKPGKEKEAIKKLSEFAF